ncbi:MAG: phosphoribosylanthranilate isomerase [Burkholderiaceae bacterium]|nr:phosphoribosylanthranilate isomerase [Burkholderiaceae bacterium]
MQNRTRIKICGLTRLQDVQAAVAAGADAIGMVFYPQSSRALTLAQAIELRAAVPAFVTAVALFVNADRDQVQDVIDQVQPDILQFHGDETPAYCQSFNHRYMRAFRVGAPSMDTAPDLLRHCLDYPDAVAWLFDSYSASYGGSGLKFDTTLLHDVQQCPDSRPLVLAGGLTPQTVSQALRTVQPYAVDVSSGVEDAPGVKSIKKMQAFIAAVQGTAGH